MFDVSSLRGEGNIKSSFNLTMFIIFEVIFVMLSKFYLFNAIRISCFDWVKKPNYSNFDNREREREREREERERRERERTCWENNGNNIFYLKSRKMVKKKFLKQNILYISA